MSPLVAQPLLLVRSAPTAARAVLLVPAFTDSTRAPQAYGKGGVDKDLHGEHSNGAQGPGLHFLLSRWFMLW